MSADKFVEKAAKAALPAAAGFASHVSIGAVASTAVGVAVAVAPVVVAAAAIGATGWALAEGWKKFGKMF